MRRTSAPFWPWLPVANHWPSGLTATSRQSSGGPTGNSRSGVRDMGDSEFGRSHDSARAVLGYSAKPPRRQREPARRADAESSRSGSSWTGHRRGTPRGPRLSVSRSPEDSNRTCAGSSDRQERQLRAAGQVPQRRAGRCPAPAPGRRGGWMPYNIRSAHRKHGQRSGTRGPDRPSYVVRPSSCTTTIPPVPAEFRWVGPVSGQAQDGPAEDRVPEPQPAFPAVAGQSTTEG